LIDSSSGLKSSPHRRLMSLLGWPLILGGMVTLLVTVALLQYRWTNEASAASEMRIGAQIESLMMKWHADLYGEFSAICTAMQVGPDSGARDTWNDYLERYVAWNGALPHETLPNVYRNPDLVQDIYIWDTNLGTSPRLFRLNAETKKIEAAKVPENLGNLLTRLRANSASLSKSLRVWQLPTRADANSQSDIIQPRWPAFSSNTGWQFDENVPAVVHPIFQRDGRSLSSQSPVDWMVVVLDLNALRKRILPDLASRYFGGLEGLEYKVALVANGTRQEIIYSSDPGFGTENLDAADATLSIFGPPADSAGDDSQQQLRTERPLRSTEWHHFYGSAWFPVIQYESRTIPWLLVLQHRAGPLQAIISRVRGRNLAVSAFVLALLAANMALLTVAIIRAQKFTKLQMDFVASVSHELRTPLTTIFSAAENIKDGVVRDQVVLADYGSIVMSQSRHLMDHVDRILLFASMRSGKDRYNIRALQVSDILQRVRRSVAGLIIEESFTLEEVIEPDLPQVLGDVVAVRSCLENLITNAIKYSGSDRRIRISATLEKTEEGPSEVAIRVEDHGIGIRSSELKQIFEPFYRSPEAVQAHIAGTGLGLSVSRHLAEAMGGRLSVKSEPGAGSVFTLHLRAVAERRVELASVPSSGEKVARNE